MSIVTCTNCGAKNRVDETRASRKQPVCGRCGKPIVVTSSASSLGHSITVTDETFERDVLAGASDKPILVDFWAAWCGPCRMLAPTLDQLAAESGGRYVIAKLNVDENPRTAERYNISGIPAMLIFKDGRKVDELIGLAPKHAIAAKLAAIA
jgi:thioredoxin 2